MNNYIIFGKNIIIKEDIMNTLFKGALVISIIGCINWGLVGLLNFNLVEYLLGDGSLLTRIVYVLVMVCGLINIGIFTKNLDR
jgi:uncharacterized membrane protein YuzA (DUF378 family)